MNNTIPFNAGLAYAEFKSRQAAFILAGTVACAASSTFVINFFAGSLHITEWTLEQWFNGLLALGIVAAVTVFQGFLYAQGEEAKGDRLTILATVVAVSFGLFTEISQSMERNEARKQLKAESSQTYQNLQSRIKVESSAPSANPYAGAIAQAQAEKAKHEFELSRCDRYAATHGAKRVEKCQTYEQGKIAEANGQIAAYNAQATGAANSQESTIRGLVQDARAMETDDNNMQPIIKLFAEWFGLAMISASFAASAFVIAVFEFAFKYLGKKYAKSKAYLMRNGYDVTRKLRQPPRKRDGTLDTYSDKAKSAPVASFAGAADSARQTVAEFADKAEQAIRNAPETIGNELMQAQAARNQLHRNMQTGADRMADTLDKTVSSQPAPEQLPTQAPDISHPAPRMSVAETIRAIVGSVQKSGASSPADIQAATTAAYSNLFNPADFTLDDLHKVAAKIARDLKPAGAAFTPEPARPSNQKTGATGLQNPDLGTAEEQHEIALPQPPHAHVGGKSGQPHAEPVPHAPHAHVGGIQPGTEEALKAATDAPAGSMVGCPQCGTQFKKRNPQHRFCCAQHRDAWHNERNPKKQQFLKNRNMLA